MWRTVNGKRTLQGAEAELVRELLALVYDQVDDPHAVDFFCSGVACFDNLEPDEQLALLAEVGSALLEDEVESPQLTAVREGVIAALFETLRDAIEFEIDCEDDACDEGRTSWRSLLLRAYGEAQNGAPVDAIDDDDDQFQPLEPTCTDMGEWELVIDVMANQILWDRDWELEDLVADSSPEHAAFLKAQMGIQEDYFTDVAPHPRQDSLHLIREKLNALTGASH